MKKTLAVLVAASLAMTVFAALPAEAKKKKKKKACAALQAGPMGAEAETIKLTDAATAEAPVEIPATFEMSLGDADFVGVVPAPFDPSQFVVNVQVDPAAAETGLYITWEFPARRDYDIFVRHNDDSEAASSHGFQPALEVPQLANTDSNHAGESTASSENIIGLRTADCGGYTLDLNNWLGEGGDMVIKAWLGEATTDPRPVGEVPHEE